MKLPESEIIALYRAGKTHKQIAAATRVDRTSIGNFLLKTMRQRERDRLASRAKSRAMVKVWKEWRAA